MKLVLILSIVFSSVYAVECEESYAKHGCGELSYALGEDMKIQQYQVIFDGDQDGVVDTKDQCPETPPKMEVDEYGCHHIVEAPVEEPVVEEIISQETQEKIVKIVTLKVNFKTAKYDILKGYSNEIEEFANFLIANPEFKAKITGHTDSRSVRTDNYLLSLNRAKAVRDRLIELGVSADVLSVDGMGPDEPIASNDTKAGRLKNRRIEVTVTKEEN